MKPIFKYKLLFLVIAFFCLGEIYAQLQPNTPQQSIVPTGKAARRYEIDAKRLGVDPSSEDALPRSREFIRLDSSYYVGWYYQGVYKFNHAADYQGYKNAIQPLERALYLMEKDFKKDLKTRSSDVMTYYPTFKYKFDYSFIAYYLVQAYSNTDDPEAIFKLLARANKWNFQYDPILDIYNWYGWTVHRNRFYTSDKYFFLKNSIVENEALANRYLDSGLRLLYKNRAINSSILAPGYDQQMIWGVYHYKSILHSYALNIDSAAHYYGLLKKSNVFPHNNYATFRMITGDFRTAEEEYQNAAGQEQGDKRLKEYVYYSSIIDLYKGHPDTGAEMLRDMIKANGSTPGFGWYNIALARCNYYDGNLKESERYIDKAAKFKELHIGTTLGQSHYEFSVQLNKLMNTDAKWYAEKFEHRNWWYNVPVLSEMARLLGEKYLQQYLIINQFAQNPERDRVIYKLFSTESTVTWDEVWHLIKDFSTNYFLERFEKELKRDDRKNILKYYSLFLARLHIEKGEFKKAEIILNELMSSPTTDLEYEKLFVARVMESAAVVAAHMNKEDISKRYLYRMYLEYPQLVPYTGMSINLELHPQPGMDPVALERLKSCNFSFENKSSDATLHITVGTTLVNGKKTMIYSVADANRKTLIPEQKFLYKNSEKAGVELAYRIFNIKTEPGRK